MENLGIISFYGLIFGIIGTTIGGFIGAFLKVSSNRYLSFTLEFAAGLMTAIICFDLIPESLEIIDLSSCIIGIFTGILAMIYCNKIVSKYSIHSIDFLNIKHSSLFQTGIIIALGLAIHNFPEGLAIGAGFESSTTLGLKLAIAIALHDIPEGISIALPLTLSGSSKSKSKSILITTLSGLTTGLGAFFGVLIGNISQTSIGLALSFAAGCMLYIVSCELIPESKKRYSGKFGSLGFMFGLILGLLTKAL